MRAGASGGPVPRQHCQHSQHQHRVQLHRACGGSGEGLFHHEKHFNHILFTPFGSDFLPGKYHATLQAVLCHLTSIVLSGYLQHKKQAAYAFKATQMGGWGVWARDIQISVKLILDVDASGCRHSLCHSWTLKNLYLSSRFFPQVLLPTNSLDTVPPPGTGLTAGQPAGQLAISGLFPGLRIGTKQSKATGRCPQAFLDAANKQNLTFLVQVRLPGISLQQA